jgi:hypothetical protein
MIAIHFQPKPNRPGSRNPSLEHQDQGHEGCPPGLQPADAMPSYRSAIPVCWRSPCRGRDDAIDLTPHRVHFAPWLTSGESKPARGPAKNPRVAGVANSGEQRRSGLSTRRSLHLVALFWRAAPCRCWRASKGWF